MPLEHGLVVHFVNMIGGQDQDMLGGFGKNALRILKDRVGGALVPAFAHLLHGGNDLDIFVQFRRQNAPAVAHVTNQIERFVLREDKNTAHIGVDAVGKSEVDNAIRAAERDGGLSHIARQGIEPFARAAGEQNR